MDWKEFVIELVDKTLWPLVAVWVLLTFRKAIGSLIPLAKKLKYKEFEIEFGSELEQVGQELEVAFPPKERKRELLVLANKMPNTAVLESWQDVSCAAERCLTQKSPSFEQNPQTPYKDMEKMLVEHELLDSKQGKIFADLRRLRNKVAHAEDFRINAAEALQFLEYCLVLIEHLNELVALPEIKN